MSRFVKLAAVLSGALFSPELHAQSGLPEAIRVVSVRPEGYLPGDTVVAEVSRSPATVPQFVFGDRPALIVEVITGRPAYRVVVPASRSRDPICIKELHDVEFKCQYTDTLRIVRALPTTDLAPGDTIRLDMSLPLSQPAAHNLTVAFNDKQADIVNVEENGGQLHVTLPAGLADADSICVHMYSGTLNIPGPCDFRHKASVFGSLPWWWPVGAPLLASLATLLLLVASRRKLVFAEARLAAREHELKRELKAAEAELLQNRFTIGTMTPAADATSDADPTAPTQAANAPVLDLPTPPEGLLTSLRKGRCVLFAGGGIAAQAGLPSWIEGLIRISMKYDPAMLSGGTSNALPAAGVLAELLASRLPPEKLVEEVELLYGELPTHLPPAFQLLGALPFVGAVSPNWDQILEKEVFAARNPLIASARDALLLAESLREARFTILKLWGDPRDPRTFIFTPEQYRRATYDNPTFSKYLATVFVERTVFFIGTSVAGITDFFSALPVGTGSTTRGHFALIPWTSDIELHREILRSKYGVELLVYTATQGFPEVAQFLERLRDSVGPATVLTPEIQPAILSQVILHNIGPFDDLSLDLQPGWNVLLGNNGCGKSTILRAISLGLCGDEVREKAAGAAANLLRVDRDSGFIELVVGSARYRTELQRDRNEVRVVTRQLTPLQAGKWVVLGFPPLRGASFRSVEGPSSKDAPAYPVVEDLIPLLRGSVDTRMDNLKQWIVNVVVRAEGSKDTTSSDAARYRDLKTSFFKLMDRITPGEGLSFSRLDTNTWRVMVKTHSGIVPIESISQGMSSMMAWVGVLLLRMFEIHGTRANPEQQNALVLVDEIDAHMHPEWQRTVVGFVRDHFKNLQVIATTHSPLVVGTMLKEEVMHVRRNETTRKVEVRRPDFDYQGLRADQILTSPAFELETTLDSTSQTLLKKYASLAGRSDRTEAELKEFLDIERAVNARIPSHHETESERRSYALNEAAMIEKLVAQPADAVARLLREASDFLSRNEGKGQGQGESDGGSA